MSLLAILALAPASLLSAANVKDASLKESIALMQEISGATMGIRETAARIESFNRTPLQLSRISHTYQLNELREQMNALAPAVGRLEELSASLGASEQKTIARAGIAARTLAAEINATILKQNEIDGNPSLNVDYCRLVESVYKRASSLNKTLDAAADYSKARGRAEQNGIISAQSE
ncbi:hypothetical protein [uncultured Paludibaculum sp.]|uniref:hypothetical protein n=1 Tax=uncultured Paludibaculum sp. TaxID=1765020 RepID=UPI002AAAACDB|nr:hypothetical protein [uncultured Paludibaculum sp.]